MLKLKRVFDIFLASFLLLILAVPMLCVCVSIKLGSRGPVLYWSKRIGRKNNIFLMPKFRTMLIGTPEVATHTLKDPEKYVTKIGAFLRKTSLDELPQLYCILKGEMSFVGPRPALYNQQDLIQLRSQRGICLLIPGLTGWAQVNGRDDLPIPVKVDMDEYYLHHQSFLFDLKILILTAVTVFRKEGVMH